MIQTGSRNITLKMSVNKVHLRHFMVNEFLKEINIVAAIKNIQNVYQDQTPAKQTEKMVC